MTKKKIKVGILFGGKSAEHEVSLQSAKNIIEALDNDRFEPVLIGVDKEGKWLLPDSSNFLLNSEDPKLVKLNSSSAETVALAPHSAGKLVPLEGKGGDRVIDVVFPILHGPFGEDGTVQGLLKLAGVPFVGAGVLGSAVGMDKDVMKRLLRDAGVPTARFLTATDTNIPSFDKASRDLGTPLFVKPANLGSSVGVSKVSIEEDYDKAVRTALSYDAKIIIEEFIDGREVECAVLGNDEPKASVVGGVTTRHEFYSYEAKYIDEKGADLSIPADITPEVAEQVRGVSLKTFTTLSCAGLARVDSFVAKDGKVYVNEINTMPGFTKISMYPKLWEYSGISYTDLISQLIDLAFERFEKEQKLKSDYEDN